MQEQASQSAPQEAPQAQADNNNDNGNANSPLTRDSLHENVQRYREEHAAAEGKNNQQEDAQEEQQEERRKPPQPQKGAYAALHRQQVKNAEDRQALAAERAELDKVRKAIENGKRSPADALKAMGWESTEQFLQKIAESGGEMTPEQQKIWDLEERLAAREKQEEEMRAQQREQEESSRYQNEVNQWCRTIRSELDKPNNPWNKTLAALPGQEQQILQLIQEQHNQYGENLDVNEAFEYALDKVNRALESQMRQGLKQVVANPAGKAILDEIVGSVTQSRSPSNRASKQQGITSKAVQQTNERVSDKDLSLDEMLQRNTSILRNESRRY